MMGVYVGNFIECLEDLENFDLQKVAWFDNDQGLSYSFDENVEDLFFGTCFNAALEDGEIVFNKKTDQALHELEMACDALGYDWAGKEKQLLESDEMKIIREMAKRCLKLIDESDGSESTVKYLKAGEPQPD
jgi:hypothetical protein